MEHRRLDGTVALAAAGADSHSVRPLVIVRLIIILSDFVMNLSGVRLAQRDGAA